MIDEKGIGQKTNLMLIKEMLKKLPLEPIEKCEKCLKPFAVCFCQTVPEATTKLKILILQHPQEPKELLSTTPLISSSLKNVQVKIGLSWPNFKKAVETSDLPSEWAVVYLGSGIKWPEGKKGLNVSAVNFVDKKSFIRSSAEQLQLKKQLKGIIFLDGTWAQAKTLWWRNAWLLKLPRIILLPSKPSAYGKIRREPKKDCLSTLESVALSLNFFGESKASESLESIFEVFLTKIKDVMATSK